MGFFNNGGNATTQNNEAEQALNKALTAGYGTDAAGFADGRALMPEDLEGTLTNILSETDNDCKFFKSLHTQPVKNTVHQIARRTDYGEHRFNSIPENGSPRSQNQKLERMTFDTKYIATEGSVSKVLDITQTLEDAYETEKLAAVNRVALTVEDLCFHGNSDVVDTEFDGIEKVLRTFENKSNDAKKNSTVIDLHGIDIGTTTTDTDIEIKDSGEALFDKIATDVFNKGGKLDRLLYPSVLAEQFKNMYKDKMRVLPSSNSFTFNSLPDIDTAIGQKLRVTGDDAGADKLFRPKMEVFAMGDKTNRPFAPKTVAVEVTSSSDSRFFTNDAGVYKYAVHAVNASGISAGTDAGSTITVAAGEAVKITITPNDDGPAPSGYIITRSAPDGNILMEMVQIPAKVEATTDYIDVNRYLPGTASLVALSPAESMGKKGISLGQLMPITAFPLPVLANLAKRFVVAWYGMLEVRNPEHHALIENIGYRGGLYGSAKRV